MNRKTVLAWVGLGVMLISASASAQEEDAARANAADLLQRAQQGIVMVVAAARQDPALPESDPKSKPFWNGIQDANLNIEKAASALADRDNAFFKYLASAVAGYIQADVAMLMNGSNDQRLNQAMSKLGGILNTLNENYSKEAARLNQGGPLTAAERKQLDELIRQQDELLRKLDQVEKNVAANNKQMQQAIKAMKEESRKLKRARRTASGFATGFFTAHILYDWLWGWHWWWGPWGGWCPGFIDINIIIWDSWADDFVYDWALTEAYVDTAELELDYLDAIDIDTVAELEFLEAGDWGFDDDIGALTAGEDWGWDSVSTEEGAALVDEIENNMDLTSIYDHDVPIETFEDHSLDDFGADFGSDMDFGADFFDDW